MALIFGLDPTAWHFAAPQLLWLLVIPALLLALWVRETLARARARRELSARRVLPTRERLSRLGDLPLWLALVLATACVVIALARPQALVSRVRTGGIDLVVLVDASASMYVQDVPAGRWGRAMDFLGVLGNALSWKDDRMALAIFANIAMPQVRLTRDPTAFFFFLDHLDEKPPFRLEDDQTWDTNAEQGIHWGLRLVEKDAELNGTSRNAAAFVLVSDGQVWSGDVEQSLDSARARGIPVYVVGVGTTFGGPIPEPKAKPRVTYEYQPEPAAPTPPVRSGLNRTSLRAIATAGAGQYYELDRTPDREIANAIVDAARRRSPGRPLEEVREELYWPFLLLAAGVAGLGMLWLRDRAELWLGIGVAAATAVTLWPLLR